MNYSIKAHETLYNGVLFRSRLEARWAAFFDIVGWEWEYEPIDINGWTPDFKVKFPCGHSECPNGHTLLVEVKPYYDINEFKGHPCMDYPFGIKYEKFKDDNEKFGYGYKEVGSIPADASAAFGINPDITYWEMVHGHGGGIYKLSSGWVRIDINLAWKKAGNATRYNPNK